MKIRCIDRWLSAISGFVVLLLGITGILVLIGIVPLDGTLGSLLTNLPQWVVIVLIVVCALLAVVGVHGILMLILQKKESRFVKQETDDGNLSISIEALEVLARKCAESHQHVNVRQVQASRTVSGVQVDLHVLVPSGVIIPEVIGQLQRHVRQYVGDCSGVMVDGVAVQIETDTSRKAIIPVKLMAGDEKKEEEEKEKEKEKDGSAPNENQQEAAVVCEPSSSEKETAEEIPVESTENPYENNSVDAETVQEQ